MVICAAVGRRSLATEVNLDCTRAIAVGFPEGTTSKGLCKGLEIRLLCSLLKGGGGGGAADINRDIPHSHLEQHTPTSQANGKGILENRSKEAHLPDTHEALCRIW